MNSQVKKQYTIKKVNKQEAQIQINCAFVKKRIAIYEGIELKEKFRLGDSINKFEHYGEGLFFYFFFLKYFSIIFFLFGCLNFFQLYNNFTSVHPEGTIRHSLYQQNILKSTIGNLPLHQVILLTKKNNNKNKTPIFSAALLLLISPS